MRCDCGNFRDVQIDGVRRRRGKESQVTAAREWSIGLSDKIAGNFFILSIGAEDRLGISGAN